MGRIDKISDKPTTRPVDLPNGVYVVAQPHFLEAIEGLSDSVTGIACEIEDALPLKDLSFASIVVIEVDPSSHNSLERVDQLRSELPSVPVIAGLADVDIATSRQLLRRGVSDIVALPIAVDELVTAISDTAEQIASEVSDDVELAPFIAVLNSIGGSGSTTIATHLASQMAEDMGDGARACVIDLDLQSGDVSSFLGCTPRQDLSELMEAGNRLDDELLRAVAIDSGTGVDVIAAPSEIVPIEALDFEQLMRIITMARKQYDVVIVDLPASFTNWSLSTVFAADQAIIVGTLTIPSLRHAKRQLDFLISMGIPRNQIQIVLNRVEKKLFKTIDSNDAAKALKHPILATVCNDYKLIRTAQDQGELADALQPRSKFSKDIANLAQVIWTKLDEVG
jgi:pilus assembly protein CpaE